MSNNEDKHTIYPTSIFPLSSLSSSSFIMSTVLTTTITEHLYHPLYTLWLPCRPGNLLSLASPENYEQADEVLQESPVFQAYLHHVETGTANSSP
jgi:hypothetical protein